MGGKRTSKSGVFLIELIIAILFFSVASVICVQLFVKAQLISRESQDVSAAVALAQDCAERFKQMDSEAKELLIGANDGTQVRYFGRLNGTVEELAGPETAEYTLTARYSESVDAVYRVEITVCRPEAAAQEPLFTLEAKDYAGSPNEVEPLA